jgi:hypothetical protein
VSAKQVAGRVLVICVSAAVVCVVGYYVWMLALTLWRHLVTVL